MGDDGDEVAPDEVGGVDGDQALSDLADELAKPVEMRDPTPEELVAMRDAAARLRRLVDSPLTARLGDLGRSSALARLTRGYPRLTQFQLPDSALHKFGGVGAPDMVPKTHNLLAGTGLGLTGNNSALTKFLAGSAIDPVWVGTLPSINSDVYRSVGLGQANLTKFSSALAKNADFGFNSTAEKLLAKLATDQLAWLSNIGRQLASLTSSIYPPNLEGIDGLMIEDVEQVVMLDGIALYGVPRTDIAEALVRAPTSAARREILGRRWKAISSDCREALTSCTAASVRPDVKFALKALDALDAGNPHAAQALAASVLDTVVNRYFGKRRFKLTPNARTRTNAEYEEFPMREYVAFAPLWQAYQRYKPEEGDPVPRTFSRHASVHGVSARQFSRRNAMQAVMFVSGLLLFLDEESNAAKAA